MIVWKVLGQEVFGLKNYFPASQWTPKKLHDYWPKDIWLTDIKAKDIYLTDI
jgi:hypothetical protein